MILRAWFRASWSCSSDRALADSTAPAGRRVGKIVVRGGEGGVCVRLDADNYMMWLQLLVQCIANTLLRSTDTCGDVYISCNCLSVCLSVSVSICLTICQSVRLSVSVFLSVCQSVSLSFLILTVCPFLLNYSLKLGKYFTGILPQDRK